MRFDPATGLAEHPGQAALWASTGGERVKVSVGAMGRPTVCTAEGSLPPFAAC